MRSSTINLVSLLVLCVLIAFLSAGCTAINYNQRVRLPATSVKWFYVDNPDEVCSKKLGRTAVDRLVMQVLACTIFPDANGMNDPDPTHFMRAEVYVHTSEKDNPSFVSTHEQGHVDGFDH